VTTSTGWTDGSHASISIVVNLSMAHVSYVALTLRFTRLPASPATTTRSNILPVPYQGHGAGGELAMPVGGALVACPECLARKGAGDALDGPKVEPVDDGRPSTGSMERVKTDMGKTHQGLS
jgi:hypothetical protein